jgi:hypothetical protein
MSAKLLLKDYKNILDFYNIPKPKSNKQIKEKAEDIMATKLCRCIKKIKEGVNEGDNEGNNEGKAIAICSKSIFTKKGYKRGAFNCLRKRKVNITKKR